MDFMASLAGFSGHFGGGTTRSIFIQDQAGFGVRPSFSPLFHVGTWKIKFQGKIGDFDPIWVDS